jgi:hypothetical protein
MAAEQMLYGNAQGGGDDMRALTLLWQTLDRPAAEGVIKQRWAALQAKTLLEKHREAFDALTSAMAERASVEDCRRIIQQNIPLVSL